MRKFISKLAILLLPTGGDEEMRIYLLSISPKKVQKFDFGFPI